MRVFLFFVFVAVVLALLGGVDFTGDEKYRHDGSA